MRCALPRGSPHRRFDCYPERVKGPVRRPSAALDLIQAKASVQGG